MGKLCLMASNGYPPGLVLLQEQGTSRVIKDCQPLPCQVAGQEVLRSDRLNLKLHQSEEQWKPLRGLCECNQFVKLDSAVAKPVLIDVQDSRPDSINFSLGIAKQCTRHEKILQFITSRSSEGDEAVLDLSLLSDLMGLKASFHVHQQPSAPSFIYPTYELYDQKPFLDFVGDMARNSKISVHSDGRVLFTGSGMEMNDFLSLVAEFYLSKNATRWTKQSLLVPHFDRLPSIETQADIHAASLTVEATTVAPLKSPEKIKVKPPPRKNNKKIGRERDFYRRNYFHACESLLSLMINKRQHRKTAILSLKKSGPELPELLNQFSAGLAGTGLAVLFSVICKVACGRAPFCGYKALNTGLAFGLVWLSWAVNSLRDAVVIISKINKNASKMGLNEEETMRRVEKSVNDIYFRAATLMAVAVLRFA